MELKVDELIVEIMSLHKNPGIQSLYDAIRVLLTPDDNRVLASQVYGYARKFAKIEIPEALVDSLHTGLSSPDLISACITLKAVAVNGSNIGSPFEVRRSSESSHNVEGDQATPDD
ncbi:armadillo repeat-containing protein [Trifolium repens]|nr:armadillo repeat-containing protein [Trifolium repens]KAK2444117.1 armadillo repeat-containing protein [Trifolium repens]